MSLQLSAQQKETLTAICDAIIPSIQKNNDTDGYWQRKASDLQVADQIIDLIANLPTEDQVRFKQLLNLLQTSLTGLIWAGTFKEATKMTVAQREKLLQNWSKSRLEPIRNGFNTLKKLTCLIYYGGVDRNKTNPNWKTLGYPGPYKTAPIPPKQPLNLLISNPKETEWMTDVVIVGSGAGGGVAAGELSKAGKQVIVVEKGDYVPSHKMTGCEVDMIGKLYEQRGALTSQSGSITVLAGSCVGGGTTVNWAGSFRTPGYVLQEWADEHANPQFLDKAYHAGFDAIEKRLGVNTNYNHHNFQNQVLLKGAKKLGYHHAEIPRNVVAHPNESATEVDRRNGYGTLGDAYGNKQCMSTTYLADAQRLGTKIMANTHINRVIIKQGEAVGVEGYQTLSDGTRRTIRIRAKTVIVSAGAIHTPAILRRSGLRHPHIGQHLYLHPVNAVYAIYDTYADGWHGPMMSAVSDEFTHLDGNYGVKLETPPLHTGFLSLALPWTSGKQLKTDALLARHTASTIVLTRDKYGGQVKLGKEKKPLLYYKLHDYDRKHLIRGLQEAARIHEAAGAKKVVVLHNQPLIWQQGADFERFIADVPQMPWQTNYFNLFSAHQMGTCRMGGMAKLHPLLPTGETREVKNLYVADASAFPKCSGANPMLSIQALAYYVAKRMQ